MRRFALLIILALVPSIAWAGMKRRVYYMPDGTVKVAIPSPNACREGESGPACAERLFADIENSISSLKVARDSNEYDDVSPSALPSRADRKYWKGSKATGITIDTASKETDRRAKQKIKDDRKAARAKLKALGLTDKELDALGIR